MSRNSKKINILLWTVQAALALLFVFAGGMKLILPLAALEQGPIVLPGAFIRFIGAAELLGGLGLVLPRLFRVARYLTPLAASGLGVIMAGATTLTAVGLGWSASLFPLVVGALLLAVCVGRRGTLSVGRHDLARRTPILAN